LAKYCRGNRGGKGHEPHLTSTYEEALAALADHHFSLAIVDPVLDRNNSFNRAGVSIIQKINELLPTLPVIVITGSLTADIRASLNNIRPDAPVVFKETWNPAEFGRLIWQHLSGQAGTTTIDNLNRANLAQTHEMPMSLPPTKSGLGRPRILLVENRLDWRDIVVEILARENYFWRLAGSASEALAELERENFHLVVLDLKLQENELPARSNEGWLLLDHLVEAYPKTKVVILSGRATPSDVANLLTNYKSIIGFIEKQSFDAQLLIDAVNEATRAPEFRIQTFSRFRLWRDGQVIEVWERPQAEVLVKLLLVRRAQGGRAVTTDELITRLWPDSDEARGRKKLLPLISNARHTLEPDIEPRDSNFVLRSGSGYFFDLSGRVSWDLVEFRNHLKEGRHYFRQEAWPQAIAELEQGRALYKGDFLAEDRYADWAIAVRHDVANDYRDLLVYLADAYAANGRYPEAIAACEDALRKDPLLESVYRRLMRFHACQGDKAQALKVYRDCLKLFEELFEESPTPTTRRLYEAIAADEPIECLAERLS
jgi:DNA-binding SARP family transcriptional activator/CheY-like chemotaxis protein